MRQLIDSPVPGYNAIAPMNSIFRLGILTDKQIEDHVNTHPVYQQVRP